MYDTMWFTPGRPLTTTTSASGGFASGRDKRRYGELGEGRAAGDRGKGRSQGSEASASDGAAVEGGKGWSQGSEASTFDEVAVEEVMTRYIEVVQRMKDTLAAKEGGLESVNGFPYQNHFSSIWRVLCMFLNLIFCINLSNSKASRENRNRNSLLGAVKSGRTAEV